MKDDIQKMIVQFQILEANLKALQERAEIMNERLEEIKNTKIALEELEEAKPSKALVSIGIGSFVSGTIENTKDVIIGVGSGVAIKKKREDAIAILESRSKETETSLNEISNQSTKIAFQLAKIQEEIEKLQR